VPRRTAEEAAATRRRLLEEGRRLFVAHGYERVTADDLAGAAGVTRGALHHHFGDKRGLFEAVYAETLAEFDAQISEAGLRAAEETGEVWPALVAGIDRYLDLCLDPAYNQVMLTQGPIALGWERWDEMDREFSLRQVSGVLELLVATGDLADLPIVATAEVLVGALNQVGRRIALAEDPVQTRNDLGAVVLTLFEGLRLPSASELGAGTSQ
jgi:AcrR family transcriptional regulator